jgi:YYY domain-containing protein
MGAVLVWWLAIQLVGFLALPLTYRVFKGLPDRGYAFARPLGLLLAGYIFWMAGSLGILRNDLGGVLAALFVLACLSLYVGRRELGLVARRPDDGPTLWQFLREHATLVVLVELLFFLVLGLWALYRAYSPDIATAGGEKFMEYAFINATRRTPGLPPADPWLSGYAISYYYFGYLIMSMLIRLSGLASNIAFNLCLALLFALTITGSFSLVYNLVRLAGQRVTGANGVSNVTGKAMGFGLLGSVLVAIMGNLEGFFELLYTWRIGGAGFWRWLDIRDLTAVPAVSAAGVDRYLWWWRASRVLQDRSITGGAIEIIDEFPFFSFMLGDIHPHVLALPFVLLTVGLALNLLANRKTNMLSLSRPGRDQLLTPTLLLYAVCLGGTAFLNTWDLPICLAILGLAFMARTYWVHGAFNRAWLVDVLSSLAMLTVVSVALYIPFYVGFQSQAGGPALALWAKTRIQQYLIMFAPFIFVVVGMLAVLLPAALRARRDGRRLQTADLLIGGFALILVVLSIATGRWLGLLLALMIAGLLYSLWHLLRDDESAEKDVATVFATLLLAAGLGLTFMVEFVYLRDTFNNRMNTIFKFYYQAWTLLAIGAGYGVFYVWERARSVGRVVFAGGFGLLLAAGLVYPALAPISRADNFQHTSTLDGIAYIREYWPGDYAATEWLKETVKEPAVILEANGGSYTQYGRVSALTGIPTLLGWGGHELQWQGNYDEPGRRERDIEDAYRSTDANQIEEILRKYDVTYVYVGQLEREKFSLSDPMVRKFDLFMDLVYDQGDVRIYRRRGV